MLKKINIFVFYDFWLKPPQATYTINIKPNNFYLTPSGFYYVSVPCASQKVLRKQGNNDAGAANAHSNFGRLSKLSQISRPRLSQISQTFFSP